MKPDAIYQFRLYIAGDGPNSARAVANLQQICEEHLAGKYTVETVDVLVENGRALADGVLLTPLLVKLSPLPLRKIIGNLSAREAVLQAIGLPIQSP